MSYINYSKKLEYDPKLIQLIKDESDMIDDDETIKKMVKDLQNEKNINKKEFTKNLNYNQYPNGNRAANIERLRQAIKNISMSLAKIVIGMIIERFVSNKVDAFALKVIKNNENNKQLVNFIDQEINTIIKKHPDYKRCTLEQFKKTTMFNYMLSDWRDKDLRQIALEARKHVFDAALIGLLIGIMPIPGSTTLRYPIKAALQYMGIDLGTSITQLVMNFNSHCLSMGLYLRPIGYVINNITLYSFKSNGRDLIASDLKNPPEDLYRITHEEAKKILNKYRDTELVKRDIDIIFSKTGM